MRIESDSIGEIKVPSEKYWGAQTQRSCQYFKIGSNKMPMALIYAYGHLKSACAEANFQLGLLDKNITKAIQQSAKRIINGELDSHFPLSVFQTGSGTQTNMNVNEVIANVAIEQLGGQLGSKDPVHPNDHVNRSQSSNDSFPTAMHIAVASEVHQSLMPSLDKLIEVVSGKVKAWDKIVKIGRTHLQDAVPLTMGQAFSAFQDLFEQDKRSIQIALEQVYELAIGGTAVGTGLNAPDGFQENVVKVLREQTKLPFQLAKNNFSALSAHQALTNLSGILATLASHLMKLANDVRWSASGPRCGIGELTLPANEPGSSIMPGKVNPTQSEALTMLAVQVMSLHQAVLFANSQGNFELNVFKPMILHNVLESIQLLSDGMLSFSKHALQGLKINLPQVTKNLEQSLMLVTALAPHIGYDKASEIAHHAHQHHQTLKQSSISLGYVTEKDFEQWVKPESMV
jgi:fumarate hydratase, class II